MAEIIFHGKMPDPFLKDDGSRMTPEEWLQQRDALREKIVDIEYGGMPPRPEYLRVEPLNDFRRAESSMWYKIYAGTKTCNPRQIKCTAFKPVRINIWLFKTHR